MNTGQRVAKAIAPLDGPLDSIEAALKAFRLTWSADVPEAVGEAWNHLHDAQRLLISHQKQVALEAGRRPIPASEQGTWELVQQNID